MKESEMPSVTEDDVRRVAELARLGVPDERLRELTAELGGILGHMRVLAKVDTARTTPAIGISAGGTPLRTDQGPPLPLAVSRDRFAPRMREGFYVVPRLATHEDPEQSTSFDDGENTIDESVLDEDAQRHQADALGAAQRDTAEQAKTADKVADKAAAKGGE